MKPTLLTPPLIFAVDLCLCMFSAICSLIKFNDKEVLTYLCLFIRYADRAKQIVCKAVVNEDPNAKVLTTIIVKQLWIGYSVHEIFSLTCNI